MKFGRVAVASQTVFLMWYTASAEEIHIADCTSPALPGDGMYVMRTVTQSYNHFMKKCVPLFTKVVNEKKVTKPLTEKEIFKIALIFCHLYNKHWQEIQTIKTKDLCPTMQKLVFPSIKEWMLSAGYTTGDYKYFTMLMKCGCESPVSDVRGAVGLMRYTMKLCG